MFTGSSKGSIRLSVMSGPAGEKESSKVVLSFIMVPLKGIDPNKVFQPIIFIVDCCCFWQRIRQDKVDQFNSKSIPVINGGNQWDSNSVDSNSHAGNRIVGTLRLQRTTITNCLLHSYQNPKILFLREPEKRKKRKWFLFPVFAFNIEWKHSAFPNQKSPQTLWNMRHSRQAMGSK